MKYMLIMVAVVIVSTSSYAQKVKSSEVPTIVKEAFAKKYPEVKAEWEKESADYEAEFDLNKVESSAVFTENGTFKEFEQEIKITTLPKTVIEYCITYFADYKLSEAAKILDATGKITYEVELNKGKEHFDAIFDDKGTFLKKM